MPRPHRNRRIADSPGCTRFKPAGVSAANLKEIVLGMDELEALRLADVEGLYHEEAARQMNVSRPTFGRIVSEARRKSATALVDGCALTIDGGPIELPAHRSFFCHDCGHTWDEPFGGGRPPACSQCGSGDFRRTDAAAGRGFGRRGRRGGWNS